jgi:hypothetical protein
MHLVRINLIAIFFIFASQHTFGSEILSCTNSLPLQPMGMRITEIKLISQSSAVIGVSYLGMFTTGKETPGYNCHFDSDEKNTNWIRQGNKSVASVVDEFGEKSTFSVTKTGPSFRIEFEKMGRNWCGAQAEFPQSVEITKGVKNCMIQY